MLSDHAGESCLQKLADDEGKKFVSTQKVDVKLEEAPSLQISGGPRRSRSGSRSFGKEDLRAMLSDHLGEPCLQMLADDEGKKFVSIQRADGKLDEADGGEGRFPEIKDVYGEVEAIQQNIRDYYEALRETFTDETMRKFTEALAGECALMDDEEAPGDDSGTTKSAEKGVGTGDVKQEIWRNPTVPLDNIPEGMCKETWMQALGMVFVAGKDIEDDGIALTREEVHRWCEDWLETAMTTWEDEGVFLFGDDESSGEG